MKEVLEECFEDLSKLATFASTFLANDKSVRFLEAVRI
jgi:hypothetical protein